MWDLINFIACFVVAGLIFYKLIHFFKVYIEAKAFAEDTNKRMEQLIKKQKYLSDFQVSTRRRGSAFDNQNKEKLEELLSTHQDALDKIKMTIRQSGIKMTLGQLASSCLTGGICLTYFFSSMDFFEPINNVLIGMSAGSFAIYSLVAYQASKQKQAFLQLFPDALDMMIRGVKAGFTLPRIIRLVSMDSKEPVAGEFKIMTQKLELGVPPKKVFADAANEIDIEEFRFLTVAFILQLENGGMLVEILSNLASIVRKRLELQLKIRAMSSEAKMSAYVLCSLPFVFAGIMMFLNPEHLEGFTKPGLGQSMLKWGAGLFTLGVISMFKMTKLKV